MNRLFKQRKAIVFSLIAVLLSILFISLYTTQFTVQGDEGTLATATRAKVIDTYVRNFEKYAESSLKVATYRNLNILTRGKSLNQGFLGSGPEQFYSPEEFNALFMNCTTCGYSDCEYKTMNCSSDNKNYGVEQFFNEISQLARDHMNINTTYTISIQNITQDAPFDVKVTAEVTYLISDMVDANHFRWNKTRTIIATVPIDGLLDPLTSMYTAGSYNYSITPTTLCRFNDSCWNITTAKQFYQRQEFRYMPNATAYLSRFWEDYSDSECCGIEAFLNITKLNVTENNSYVDHEFWTGTHICNETDYTTQTIIEFTTIDPSTHFRLDEKAAARYHITGNGVQVCNPNPS